MDTVEFKKCILKIQFYFILLKGSRNSFDLELLDYTTTFAVVPNRGAAQASVTLTVIDSKQLDYETPPTNFIVRVSNILFCLAKL